MQVVATELNLDKKWIDRYEHLLALKDNINNANQQYHEFRLIVDNIIVTTPDKCDSNNTQIRYLMQDKKTHKLYFINKEDYDLHKPKSYLLDSFCLSDSTQDVLRHVYLMVNHYLNQINDSDDLKVLQTELIFNDEMFKCFNKLIELKQDAYMQEILYNNKRDEIIKEIANQNKMDRILKEMENNKNQIDRILKEMINDAKIK